MKTGSIVTLYRAHQGPVARELGPTVIRQGRRLRAANTKEQMANLLKNEKVDYRVSEGLRFTGSFKRDHSAIFAGRIGGGYFWIDIHKVA